MLRVAGLRGHAFDELDSRPDAAGILPAAAAATDPLAEQRPGEHEPAFAIAQGTGERLGLAGRSHADADQRREEIGRDREARTFRDVVDGGDQFETAPGAEHLREEIGETLAGALDAGWDQARRDHRRLE